MSSREQSPTAPSERTPLIERTDVQDEEQTNRGTQTTKNKKTRWPSLIALSLLCVAVILVLGAGFAVPAVAEEYVKEAAVFEPQTLSIDSFTTLGVRARIEGVLHFDAQNVKKKSIRDIGRAATWIAREVESGGSEVTVYLPDYENAILGTARLPPIKVGVRDGHWNTIDMIADIEPGDAASIRKLAQDFINGLQKVNIRAVASVPIKSGIFSFGVQKIEQRLTFTRSDTPDIPQLDIGKLKVVEHGVPGHPDGMLATAEISTKNPYPVTFNVPPIAVEVLLPDCFGNYLMIGTAATNVIHILPKQRVKANVTGLLQQLPTSLTTACPHSSKSPLDVFISTYLAAKQVSVYIRGGEQGEETPPWIGRMLSETIVPIPLPVHPFENMIKNFSLADVNFNLPETPQGNPVLSAIVKVVVNLPKDMNFDVDVARVRAYADVSYKGQKMGELDLHEWQDANSTKNDTELWVQSRVKNAPLQVTDQGVFTKVIQAMIFGGEGVQLGVTATVDVDTVTALGSFVVRKIPAEGDIYVKPLTRSIKHDLREISVVGSSRESLTLQARVSATNPTDYSAHVPYVNVSLWTNETHLGYAWGSFDVQPGLNELVIQASWKTGSVGRELLSQYISGQNVSITVKNPHMNGLPVAEIAVTVPLPHVFGKFLRETTMHILSSSATFLLFSPIPMYITAIAATAVYNGMEIGTIDYDYPFSVHEGGTETPSLPVNWNSNGGLGLVRDALGGTLKLDAKAEVGVKIGDWTESLWFQTKGLGAKVRL